MKGSEGRFNGVGGVEALAGLVVVYSMLPAKASTPERRNMQ